MSSGYGTRNTRGALLLALLAAAPAVGWITPSARAAATHVVRLEANRFSPQETRVHAGDTVRFVNGPGGPHNVQFRAESIAVSAHHILNAAMRDRIAPLTSPMFIVVDETWTFVVPDLPPGRYAFLCSPHWANMRGGLTVEHP